MTVAAEARIRAALRVLDRWDRAATPAVDRSRRMIKVMATEVRRTLQGDSKI